LGAIKNGDFDLSKRLTVFTGPNNSGKTYTAILIYALTKSNIVIHNSEKFIEEFESLIKTRKISHKIDIDYVLNYRKRHIETLSNSLENIFGISEEIVKMLFNNFSINIDESSNELESFIYNENFEMGFELDNKKIVLSKASQSFNIDISLESESLNKKDLRFLDVVIFSKIYSLFAFSPFTNSYILPVERNSIYTFSKELSIRKQEFFDRAKDLTSSINNSATKSIEWYIKRSTRYPLPIRDGLEVAEDLYNFSKRSSKYYTLAEQIETELLQGKVTVNKDGDVQFISNKAKQKKIPIQLSASIVKTMSSLVFYLKHLANDNDLIIIDEPELNLHPNNQIFIARIFAKLINSGFRLLICTHSDYVIREINNLIMLSNETIRNSKKYLELGYSDDEFLNLDDVSSYFFSFKNKTSKDITVKE